MGKKTISNSFTVNTIEDGVGVPYIRVLGTGYAIERDSGGVQTEEDVQRIRLAVYNGEKTVELKLTDIQADATTNVRRGIALFAVKKSDFTIVKNQYYDTYYDVNNGTTRRAALLNAINLHKSDCYIALSSHDAYWWSQDLSNLLVSLGGKAVSFSSYSRVPFAFVGFDGVGEGKARQAETTDDESALPATVEVYIANNEFMGNKGDDVTQITLVPNPSTINFAVDANNTYTPAYVVFYCGWTITKGKESQTYDGKESSQYSTLPCSMYKRIKDSTWGSWTKITSTSWTVIQYTTQNSAYEFALSTATDASNVEDSNIVTRVVVPIVKSGEKGEQGKVGKAYYFAETWSSSRTETFVVNDYETPFFTYNNNKWVFVGENGTYTCSQMGTPSNSNENFEIMVSDFKYLITEALFTNFARLGKWYFNGDYQFSEYGYDANGNEVHFDSTHKFYGHENPNNTYTPYTYQDAKTGFIFTANITVRGVFNNLVQNINNNNIENYGYTSNTVFYINPLKVGSYIRYDSTKEIQLPYLYEGITSLKDGGNNFTFDEMRQMVGKKIYVLPTAENLQYLTFSSIVIMEKQILYGISGTQGGYGDLDDLMQNSSKGVFYDIKVKYRWWDDYTASIATWYIFECKLGIYNGKECIYWEMQTTGETAEASLPSE